MVTYFVSNTDDTRMGDGLPQVMTMGKFLHTQGYGHVILKIQLHNFIKWNIFCSFLTSIIVMLLVVIFFHNGVNQITQRLFWIEGLHPTLHIQFWCMKIARRCGKKSGTSRKASVMTFRGNKPHVKKKPSIMKDRESDSRDMVMDGRTLGGSFTKNC